MRPIKMLLALLLGVSLVACGSGPQPQVTGAPEARAPLKEVVQLKLVVLSGGFNWPLWVGMSQGFFARNGVGVKLEAAPTSSFRLVGVVNGTFDIAMGPADETIAQREGQGTQGVNASDLVIVMGGDGGFLHLASVPEVHGIADLRGKELSVDTISTGTSFVLREMLERSGLEWNRDYTTVPAGAVQERYQQLLARKHAGTMLMSPLDVIGREQGLNILADVPGTLGPYQGMVASVRRQWAQQNEAALIGFIRGYRQSLEWLYNPANRDAALAVFRRNLESDAATAQTAYRLLVDPVNGFEPHARVNEDGLRTVLRLREKYGRPAKKLQPLSAYYEPRYYEAASR
ncbi:ABC transporter substrate-binding protein [Ramlibacter sp.]|uniref:ABC transporter substrate-binding protein n=1 Tax=Ramlibacter sp. TaxID=1917967 RepID=UPI00260EF095|nr:ABC transporter substrate-binding protein [Ramlibacter sp.]MDB5958557.1 hypothetical protein [Ramlibacter sp.]